MTVKRNLVVCLDGTWDGVHGEPEQLTNVNFIARSAAFDATNGEMPEQYIHYEDGIGVRALIIDKYIMGALGKGVFQQARSAWNFLRLNYRSDDRIFIFGFSRGAYAARQLASMLVHCGVQNTTYQYLEQDYRAWRKLAGTSVTHPKVEVEFLGLFDCVPANQFVGTKGDKANLSTPYLEKGIKHFRHALAMHERRWSFRPLVFKDCGHHASFEQLVFPGYHRDIGGGGPSSEGLATIPMWWIMREAYGLGMGFRMLRCKSGHREGDGTFVGNVDRTAKPVVSDYLTTKYIPWIRHVRPADPDFGAVPIAPGFDNMAKCPKCGLDMFTPEL